MELLVALHVVVSAEPTTVTRKTLREIKHVDEIMLILNVINKE